ncbi:Olfactory receptor 1J2 [Lemmus lemmus]
MYLTTVLGNLLIILLIRLDSHLHTPMSFFLSHLPFSDISLSSITVPKMLMNIQAQQHSICYNGCISQMYFFVLFDCLDNFFLAVMAYDRCVTICHPLHYITVLRKKVCVCLVAGSWLFCCVHALLHTLLLIHLSFCSNNTTPNFFCDLTALLRLSCSDISLSQLVIFTEGTLVITLPFICILVSYSHIGATILRTPSIKGIYKALSTCGSLLSVVCLHYGAIIGLYLVPSSDNTNDKDVIVAVMYTVVTPMLTPFIYSLRNRDMKEAMSNILSRRVCSQ